MRCASIKKNKCWNRIEFELTSHSIRFLIYLFHIDVVHLSLLERVGLGGSFNLLLWALICIVSHLLTLETLNLTDISLCRLTSASTSIVVTLVSTLVVLVLVIIMTTVMLVVMMAVVAVVVVVLSMFVGSRTPTIIMMGTLVRRSRVVLIIAVLPLSSFNLFHLVLQDGSLVTK